MIESTHLLSEIDQYLRMFPVDEDNLQKQMRTQASADGKENWIIPPEVGRLFYLLAKLMRARRIYEIGSYLGYSSTWFAKALPKGGIIVLTEKDIGRFKQAKKFLADGPFKGKIDLRHCDALHDLVTEEEPFDIILIDHDKPGYCDAYHIAKKQLAPHGVIIADNVLWRNRIVNPQWNNDESTLGILEFNRLITSDPDMLSLIIPIGDGVSLSIFKHPPERILL